MTAENYLPEVRILVRNNGPLRVYGPVRVFDVNGNEYSIRAGEFFSLCRCGLSQRKPFCDSSHKRVGFDAPSDASSASWE